MIIVYKLPREYLIYILYGFIDKVVLSCIDDHSSSGSGASVRQGADVWSFLCTKEETEPYNAKVAFKPIVSGTPLIVSGRLK